MFEIPGEAMEPNSQQNEDTKERILEEAERLFAHKGYRGVSVREITQAAGVNSAAVNYHFGSKKNLYLEVFRARWIPRGKRVAQMSEAAMASAPPSARNVLKAITQAFLDTFASDDECRRHYQLASRELSQPSEALALIMNEVMKPNMEGFLRAMGPYLPANLPRENAMLYAYTVVGVLMHFIVGRAVISKLTGRQYDDQFRQVIEDHIIDFCLHGILGSNRKAV